MGAGGWGNLTEAATRWNGELTCGVPGLSSDPPRTIVFLGGSGFPALLLCEGFADSL